MKRWPTWATVGLLAALALGGCLRFAWLGAADVSGDEIGLLIRLQQQPTAGELVDDHLVQFAQFKALPLPRIAARAAVVTDVAAAGPIHAGPVHAGPVDTELLRRAFAVAGLLSVVAMAWFGYELGGASLAATAALVTALNAFQLFWSRVAHVNVFVLLFAALFYAAAVRLSKQLLRSGRASAALWATATLIAVAAGQSDIRLWPTVLLAWGFPLAAFWAFRQGRPPRRVTTSQSKTNTVARVMPWLAVLIPPMLWLLSLLPWIERWTTAWRLGLVPFEGPTAAFWGGLSELMRIPTLMAFGDGWRAALSFALPLLAFFGPRTRGPAMMLGLFGACLLPPLTLMQAPGAPAATVYGPLSPLLLMLVSLGALAASDELRLHIQLPMPVFAAAGAALLLAVSIAPARALLELRGHPAEYSRLVRALDDLDLQDGTPALVNGRSIAELEMRFHPPRHAVATFTVPDAGFEQWRNNGWRDTAEQFLRRHTDAPLVQQGRNYYDHPELGPWSFPGDYFARRVVLANRPAQRLAALGLAPIKDFYGPRTVTEISYNRPQDLVERARREGRSALALWGDGWAYAKTEDLRDWRVLTRRAELVLHNLTPEPLPVDLRLEVYTPFGRKRLRVDGKALDVPRSDDEQHLPLRRTLTPGEQKIVFEDTLYDVGLVPLYVKQFRVIPESQSEASETPP